MKPGFVVDLNRCTGCHACVVACWMENRGRQTLNWRQVHSFNAFHHPDLPGYHLSLACHHCARPACLAQCPAGAYAKDEATGAVVLDPERCMGCRYCTWACPHDAPKFSASTGVIEKCTFCLDRLREGREPACVARCPVEALGLDPVRPGNPGPVVPGFPPSRLEPGIRFVPLRREEPPESTARPAPAPVARFRDQLLALPTSKITLRGEWTLVVFTTVLSILVAWQGAALRQGPAVRPWLFLTLGAGAMALSAWHLGHPERAWRAVRNLRTSWLSREIALVSAFLGLAAVHVFGFPEARALGFAAAAFGFGALFAVDRIYHVALNRGFWNLHSAHTLLNALYLLGWLAPFAPLALAAGALKLGLYLHRKERLRREERPSRPLLSLVRVLAGFAAPWALSPVPAAVMVVLGDLVDRCEYYGELDISSPQRSMAEALGRGFARD